MKHEFGGVSVRFDYAYLPGGDLGQAHRFSLTARFGRAVALRIGDRPVPTTPLPNPLP